MLTTIQTTTTILPNGRIELTNLAIPTGEVVNLVIFLPRTSIKGTAAKRSVMDFLNQSPGTPLFSHAKAVEDYLKAERESYEN